MVHTFKLVLFVVVSAIMFPLAHVWRWSGAAAGPARKPTEKELRDRFRALGLAPAAEDAYVRLGGGPDLERACLMARRMGEEYRCSCSTAWVVAHLSPIEVEEGLCYDASEPGFEG